MSVSHTTAMTKGKPGVYLALHKSFVKFFFLKWSTQLYCLLQWKWNNNITMHKTQQAQKSKFYMLLVMNYSDKVCVWHSLMKWLHYLEAINWDKPNYGELLWLVAYIFVSWCPSVFWFTWITIWLALAGFSAKGRWNRGGYIPSFLNCSSNDPRAASLLKTIHCQFSSLSNDKNTTTQWVVFILFSSYTLCQHNNTQHMSTVNNYFIPLPVWACPWQ